MTEYRSAFYPDHALESFDVQRACGATGGRGGYYGRAVWRSPQGATAATYCRGLHFAPDPALACVKRWHEVRPGKGDDVTTSAPHDSSWAGSRELVGSIASN